MEYKAVKLSYNGYMERAKNGVSILFEWKGYRFAEGDNYDRKVETSFFIFDNKGDTYLISESDMFHFVKINFCYNQEYKDEMMDDKLDELLVLSQL
ncbi:hypothetical protein [Priestia megaterium]|uniref:hypothetical protein n=1 Tax=Priestia megaterium TaxID=1404 RepID=UPI002865C5BF|nr:hypothetical protein [Priestia megaterium]MDR7207647.1 hypothetical protein [Priestia megaterium]